jgi:nuclear pore complex protein Nup133
MNEIGEGHHEDVMRAFFRHKVTDIDRLLSQAMQVMMGGSDETDPGLLSETNHVILVSRIRHNLTAGIHGSR